MIANASKNPDGSLTDHGKLNYSGALKLQDIEDHRSESNRGFNISTSIGKSIQGKDQNSAKHPNGSTTIGLQSTGNEQDQRTKATMGQGTVKNVTNITNRDINNTQEITRDQVTGLLNGSMTVDHRLVTESGRNEIIQEQKDLPQNAEIVGKMTAAGVTSLGVATAALASGDQNLKQAYQTVMNPARTFDFVQKYPEAAVIEQFKNGDYDGLLKTKGSIELLAQALGQNVDVLTTSITSFLSIQGGYDHKDKTIILDVNSENRPKVVDTLGHEIAHGQGVTGEKSADLVGMAVDLAFGVGVKNNKDAIDQYKVGLGDGKDTVTQNQNKIELEKDNKKVLDALLDHGEDIEEKTSYWQDTKNLVACWSAKCKEDYKNLKVVQQLALEKGQNKATIRFMNDLKNLPNVPSEVSDAIKNDPSGTAMAVFKGIVSIPKDIYISGKTIVGTNLVGDTPAEFEKLGEAEMAAVLNGLSQSR